jgi:hypothetical protein
LQQVRAESGSRSHPTVERKTNATRLSKDDSPGEFFQTTGKFARRPKNAIEWLKNFQTG